MPIMVLNLLVASPGLAKNIILLIQLRSQTKTAQDRVGQGVAGTKATAICTLQHQLSMSRTAAAAATASATNSGKCNSNNCNYNSNNNSEETGQGRHNCEHVRNLCAKCSQFNLTMHNAHTHTHTRRHRHTWIEADRSADTDKKA